MHNLISNSRTVHMVDFSSVTCQELQHFEIPYRFRIDKTGYLSTVPPFSLYLS